jgi:hypothetical protein
MLRPGVPQPRTALNHLRLPHAHSESHTGHTPASGVLFTFKRVKKKIKTEFFFSTHLKKKIKELNNKIMLKRFENIEKNFSFFVIFDKKPVINSGIKKELK